jgi:hypothetical protein
VAATLRLIRKARGIELWRGRFDVTVDGTSVGTLDRQDTIETPVAPVPAPCSDLAIFIREDED